MLLMISLFGYGIYWAFFDIQRIKGQAVIQEASSPNGTYTVTAYLNHGGATTGYAVLCTVKNNSTGKEKNIYWQYHCDKVDVVWVDEQNVRINGVALNVKTDIYDYRQDH